MWNKKRELKRRYDSTAGIYDNRYEKIQERKFRAIESYIDEARKVLDVGCGTGLFLNKLIAPERLLVGVDFSTPMLEEAMKRTEEPILISADADHLPFSDKSFDLVLSFTLVQNMPDPKLTIREMKRVTELGGKLIVTGLKKKHSPEEIEEFMISAGLKKIRAMNIPGSEDFLCVGKREYG